MEEDSSSDDDGYDNTSLNFAHLFSFHVCYTTLTESAGHTIDSDNSKIAQVKNAAATMYSAASALAFELLSKVKKTEPWLNHGILQVNYAGGSFNLLDKDKIVLTQQFHGLKGIEEREDIVSNTCMTAISFQDDEWKIMPQNDVEKATLQHLVQSIMTGQSLEQAVYAGKSKQLLGLENGIIKEGTLNRKAKTALKVDQRYIVLVPGKLFIFKTSVIARAHVRYVSTLIGGTVKISYGQGQSWEFQIIIPKTKDLTLIASTEKSMREWVKAIRFAIEKPDQVPTDADLSSLRRKSAQDSMSVDSSCKGTDNISLQQLNLYGGTEQTGVQGSNIERQSAKTPSNEMPGKRNPKQLMGYQQNNYESSKPGQYQGLLQGQVTQNADQSNCLDVGYLQGITPVIEQGTYIALDNVYQERKWQQGISDGSQFNREAAGYLQENAKRQQPVSLGYSGSGLQAGKPITGDGFHGGGSQAVQYSTQSGISQAKTVIKGQVTATNDKLTKANKMVFQNLSVYPSDIQDRSRYQGRASKMVRQTGDSQSLRGKNDVDQCGNGNFIGRDPQYQNISGLGPDGQQTNYSGVRLKANIAWKSPGELPPYQSGVRAEQSGKNEKTVERYRDERGAQPATGNVTASRNAEHLNQNRENIASSESKNLWLDQQRCNQRPAEEVAGYHSTDVSQSSGMIRKEQYWSDLPEVGLRQNSGMGENQVYQRDYADEQKNRDYTAMQNNRFYQRNNEEANNKEEYTRMSKNRAHWRNDNDQYVEGVHYNSREQNSGMTNSIVYTREDSEEDEEAISRNSRKDNIPMTRNRNCVTGYHDREEGISRNEYGMTRNTMKQDNDDYQRGLGDRRYHQFEDEDESAGYRETRRTRSNSRDGLRDNERRDFDEEAGSREASSSSYKYGRSHHQREDRFQESHRKAGFGNRF